MVQICKRAGGRRRTFGRADGRTDGRTGWLKTSGDGGLQLHDSEAHGLAVTVRGVEPLRLASGLEIGKRGVEDLSLVRKCREPLQVRTELHKAGNQDLPSAKGTTSATG